MLTKVFAYFRLIFALHIDFIVKSASLQFGILTEKHFGFLFYFTKHFRNFADFRKFVNIFELLCIFSAHKHPFSFLTFPAPEFTKIFVISIVLFN